ncbi:hypothetical protein SAMN05216548_101187 [Faunimonas pinastri]|uniref:Uncharacterized protein n=1 Tax=Faunimonas pinastri TaxID=1855383 RepID=A0A1H8ZL33_9HYPH|nr:DUF6101 family protein [Faunimonas pinastri]SEP65229.1 hypothetical protein SAMN05216548_101187 [Faunimonas pinastri]
MRQTDLHDVLALNAHGIAGRDPHPANARSGDGAACFTTFDRRTVVLVRPVAGVNCMLRVGANLYEGVRLLEEDGLYVVRLVHRDPGLTVDVLATDDADEAVERCERLARALALPALGADGTAETSVRRIGRVIATAPEARRPSGMARRPRFLARRRTGDAAARFERIEPTDILDRH